MHDLEDIVLIMVSATSLGEGRMAHLSAVCALTQVVSVSFVGALFQWVVIVTANGAAWRTLAVLGWVAEAPASPTLPGFRDHLPYVDLLEANIHMGWEGVALESEAGKD